MSDYEDDFDVDISPKKAESPSPAKEEAKMDANGSRAGRGDSISAGGQSWLAPTEKKRASSTAVTPEPVELKGRESRISSPRSRSRSSSPAKSSRSSSRSRSRSSSRSSHSSVKSSPVKETTDAKPETTAADTRQTSKASSRRSSRPSSKASSRAPSKHSKVSSRASSRHSNASSKASKASSRAHSAEAKGPETVDTKAESREASKKPSPNTSRSSSSSSASSSRKSSRSASPAPTPRADAGPSATTEVVEERSVVQTPKHDDSESLSHAPATTKPAKKTVGKALLAPVRGGPPPPAARSHSNTRNPSVTPARPKPSALKAAGTLPPAAPPITRRDLGVLKLKNGELKRAIDEITQQLSLLAPGIIKLRKTNSAGDIDKLAKMRTEIAALEKENESLQGRLRNADGTGGIEKHIAARENEIKEFRARNKWLEGEIRRNAKRLKEGDKMTFQQQRAALAEELRKDKAVSQVSLDKVTRDAEQAVSAREQAEGAVAAMMERDQCPEWRIGDTKTIIELRLRIAEKMEAVKGLKIRQKHAVAAAQQAAAVDDAAKANVASLDTEIEAMKKQVADLRGVVNEGILQRGGVVAAPGGAAAAAGGASPRQGRRAGAPAEEGASPSSNSPVPPRRRMDKKKEEVAPKATTPRTVSPAKAAAPSAGNESWLEEEDTAKPPKNATARGSAQPTTSQTKVPINKDPAWLALNEEDEKSKKAKRTPSNNVKKASPPKPADDRIPTPPPSAPSDVAPRRASATPSWLGDDEPLTSKPKEAATAASKPSSAKGHDTAREEREEERAEQERIEAAANERIRAEEEERAEAAQQRRQREEEEEAEERERQRRADEEDRRKQEALRREEEERERLEEEEREKERKAKEAATVSTWETPDWMKDMGSSSTATVPAKQTAPEPAPLEKKRETPPPPPPAPAKKDDEYDDEPDWLKD